MCGAGGSYSGLFLGRLLNRFGIKCSMFTCNHHNLFSITKYNSCFQPCWRSVFRWRCLVTEESACGIKLRFLTIQLQSTWSRLESYPDHFWSAFEQEILNLPELGLASEFNAEIRQIRPAAYRKSVPKFMCTAGTFDFIADSFISTFELIIHFQPFGDLVIAGVGLRSQSSARGRHQRESAAQHAGGAIPTDDGSESTTTLAVLCGIFIIDNNDHWLGVCKFHAAVVVATRSFRSQHHTLRRRYLASFFGLLLWAVLIAESGLTFFQSKITGIKVACENGQVFSTQLLVGRLFDL